MSDNNEEILREILEELRRNGGGGHSSSQSAPSSAAPKDFDSSLNLMSMASKNAKRVIQQETESREKYISGISGSLGALSSAMTGVTKSLAAGQTSFTVMSEVVSGAAKAVSSLVSTLGPAGKLLGAGLEAAAAANSVLVGQLDISYKAFKQMNASGLVSNFADLGKISAETGVRIEQMHEVLSPLSKELARMGGANGGMSQLAKLGKASGDLRDQFYRMGINAKEFMEFQAEYITQGQRTGTTKGLTEKQLLEGTKQYIEQLDDLSKLTGMSRKELQDNRKSLQGDSQYVAMMQDKSGNQKEGMTGLLTALKAQYGDEVAKGAQHAASGMFNSPDAKKFLLTMGGDSTMMTEALEKFDKAGSPEERTKIITEVMARAQKGAGATEETRRNLAIAGKGGNVFADYAKVDAGQKFNVEGAAAAVEDGRGKRKDLQSGKDPASKYGELEQQLDKTALKLQQFAIQSDVAFKSVKLAADMTDKFIEYGMKAIDAVDKLANSSDTLKNFFNDLSSTQLAMVFGGIVVAGGALAAATGMATKKLLELAKMNLGGPGAPDPSGKGGGAHPGGGGGGGDAGGKGGSGKSGGGGRFSKIGGMLKGGVTALAGMPVGEAADFAKEHGFDKAGAGLDAVSKGMEWGGTGAMVGSMFGPLGSMVGGAVGGIAGVGYSAYQSFKKGGDLDQAAAGKLNIDDILEFGGDSGSRSNFEDLDDGFKSRVLLAAQAYNQATGKKIKINSAFRDPEKQKELYDKWIASGKQGKPVAPPGQSLHNQGAAVDIQNYNDQEAIKAFNDQGLSQKVKNDPVHFQARTGGIFKGPSTGYNVELHGDEAVIPMNDGVSKQAMNNSMFNQDSTTIKMVADALDNMNAKFDEIIDLLDDANGHHKKLVQAAA